MKSYFTNYGRRETTPTYPITTSFGICPTAVHEDDTEVKYGFGKYYGSVGHYPRPRPPRLTIASTRKKSVGDDYYSMKAFVERAKIKTYKLPETEYAETGLGWRELQNVRRVY